MAIGTLAYRILADHRGFTKGMVATRKELTLGRRIMQSMRSPLQVYQQEVDKLAGLLRKGVINQKAFNHAVGKARGSVVRAIPGFGLIKNKIVGVAAALGSIATVKSVIGLAAQAETAKVAFTNMLGSATQAKEVLAEIDEFSTATPFEPGELRDAGQKLLAFSVTAEDLLPTMKTLGDLSAGTNRPLNDFVNILGKVKDRGKISAETLNEFGLRAVPLTRALGEVLGKTGEEIQKMASRGEIGFNEMMQALRHLTSEGQLFGGAMEKQSKTLAGVWSTLTGNVKKLMESLGTALIPVLSKAAKWLNEIVLAIQSMGNPLNTATGKLVVFVGTFTLMLTVIPKVIALVKGLTAAVRAYATTSAIASALSGPKGWLTLIGSAAAAAGAVVALDAVFGSLDKELENANALTKEQIEVMNDAKEAQEGHAGALELTNDALADQQKLIQEQNRLMERGEAVTEQLKTSQEKTLDFAKELNTLVKAGAISWETYRRGIAKARKELRDAIRDKNDFNVQAPSLAPRGSQTAFAQIVNNRLQQERKKIEEEQLKVAERQLEVLEEINERNDDRLVVREVRF